MPVLGCAADQVQLDFKEACDPSGLLNPGKMRAWEEGRPVVEGVLNAYDMLREGSTNNVGVGEDGLTADMIAELDKGKGDEEGERESRRFLHSD